MAIAANFVAELISLASELKSLEADQENVPIGAHIRSLFQIAIVRIEDRIATLEHLLAAAAQGSLATQIDSDCLTRIA